MSKIKTGTIREKRITRNGKTYKYYEARYTSGFDPGTGKQIQKSITGKTKTEVNKKLREILSDLDKGIYTEPNKMTLAQWLDIWLDEYVAPSVKPLTYSSYKSQIEIHIKYMLGNLKLTDITSAQLQKFCNDLTRGKKLSPKSAKSRSGEGLSAKSVKNTMAVLSKALQQAVEVKYLPYNPVNAVKLPRVVKPEINPLTEDEVTAFLSEIKSDERFTNLFIVAVFTGMREGEICGLSWDEIDFERGTITIKQQLQKGKEKGSKHYIAVTKNGKARTITAAPYVMKVLRTQQLKQAEERLKLGQAWNNEFNLVFTQIDGSYIPCQTVLKHFKKIATKIKRPDARFHDLRHTYAVMSLQEGDDVKTVQENLGHATASFTLDVYGHVSEKMKKESAERMEKLIKKINV